MTWSLITLVSASTQPSVHNLWSLGFCWFSSWRLLEQSGVSGALQEKPSQLVSLYVMAQNSGGDFDFFMMS